MQLRFERGDQLLGRDDSFFLQVQCEMHGCLQDGMRPLTTLLARGRKHVAVRPNRVWK
jgi:hypothetical protein